jgi:arabinose-5-phosphate isomerase
MHTGGALPVVSPDAPMTEVVVEISCKRLGITVVTGPRGRVLGIITDGDLRRGIEKWGKDFFEMKARDVMVEKPKTVAEEDLAGKALALMEKHSITSLVVSDGKCAKGVIHLHDILKKGIV